MELMKTVKSNGLCDAAAVIHYILLASFQHILLLVGLERSPVLVSSDCCFQRPLNSVVHFTLPGSNGILTATETNAQLSGLFQPVVWMIQTGVSAS